MTLAQRTYDKFFASEYDGGEIPATHAQDGGTIPSTDDQEDGGQKPSIQFGRGQPLSSVSTGWMPKPIQWKLLGGAGGNTMKKVGPKTKAEEPRDGNYFFGTFLLWIFVKLTGNFGEQSEILRRR